MKNNTLAAAPRTDLHKSLAAFLFVALFAFLGMYRLQPPKAVPASAPPTEFSSERAMQHIEAIAQKPHPPTSTEHARVREYILAQFTALGLDPEVQTATAAQTSHSSRLQSTVMYQANVKNIVVRLKGTDNTKAILIAGHYDSTIVSPNASDGGTAVAIALEIARSLKAGPPLKNDVILLLTDVEERGLYGARAFVDQNPWAKDVGVTLHLVARGTSGPAIMFETSPENGWLIEQFAKSASHPIANSLAYEVYRILPNNTDFTIYKEAGLAGLNLAYIDSPAHYHTMLDNPENLDERSLQHLGSEALASTRRLGNMNLENVKKENAVYFDLLGLTMVYYPETWIRPLLLLAALAYLGVIVPGLKSKQLTFSGIVLGVLAILLTLFGTLIMIILLEQVILSLHNEYRVLYQNIYNGRLYLAGFTSLTIAIASALYIPFRKKIKLQNLVAGSLFAWLILTAVTSLLLPGASYLFLWPLLFNLLALGLAQLFKSQEPLSWQHLILFSLCAIPELVLFIPTTYLVYIALPPLTIGGLAAAMLVALLLGSLVPHLTALARPKAWVLPVAAVIVGVGFIVAGSLTAGFSAEHPKPVSIAYGLNIDWAETGPIFGFGRDTGADGEAFWISTAAPDEWTSLIFPNGASQEYDPFAFVEPYAGTAFFLGPAPVVPVPMPELVMLEDESNNGVRQIRLNLSAPQPATSLIGIVMIDPVGTVLKAKFNGADVSFGSEDKWLAFSMLFYEPSPENDLEIYIETTSSAPIKVHAEAAFWGLPPVPNLSIPPRPSHIVPSPFDPAVSDSTLVLKSFQFPAP